MKILFVGDASNMHNCLALELRKMGHTAVVASSGSRWMNTGRDINLYRHSGKIGALRYVADVMMALPQMRGFDVVEIANQNFLELRPGKLRMIFDYLKRNNRRVVLSALGTDYVYYTACHNGHTFRYSDYMIGSEPSPYVASSEYIAQRQQNWAKPMMRDYSTHILGGVDGVVACLYEYYAAYRDEAKRDVCYAGIPIETDSVTMKHGDDVPAKVRFFIGIQRDRNVIKGTDRLLAALKRVCSRYPDAAEMDVVENMPYADYLERMGRSDVILDQLYSYTPATNALLGMAQGLVAVSGAEPEYYDLIGEKENHPIVNVRPDVAGDIEAKLTWIVAHREQLPAMSCASREFVVKHNSARVVAERYLDYWRKLQ